MTDGDGVDMSDDKYEKISLSPRFVAYLETLLNRIQIKTGYGKVIICEKDGKVHVVECAVSEIPPPE